MQSFTARMLLLKATSTFGLERRRWSSPQQCCLHCLRTLLSLYHSVILYTGIQFYYAETIKQLQNSSRHNVPKDVLGSAASNCFIYDVRPNLSTTSTHDRQQQISNMNDCTYGKYRPDDFYS